MLCLFTERRGREPTDRKKSELDLNLKALPGYDSSQELCYCLSHSLIFQFLSSASLGISALFWVGGGKLHCREKAEVCNWIKLATAPETTQFSLFKIRACSFLWAIACPLQRDQSLKISNAQLAYTTPITPQFCYTNVIIVIIIMAQQKRENHENKLLIILDLVKAVMYALKIKNKPSYCSLHSYFRYLGNYPPKKKICHVLILWVHYKFDSFI